MESGRQFRQDLAVYLLALAIFGATLAVSLGTKTLMTPDSPVPNQGTVDLRAWDFSRPTPVPLGGTWDFLPELLVDGPGFASTPAAQIRPREIPDTRLRTPQGFFSGTGGGTYRLRVQLPPGATDLGLRYSTVWTAFEVEVNQTTVLRVGSPSQSPDQERPAFGAGVVPLGPSANQLELLVRVSNHQFRWGGIVAPLILGSRTTLETQKRQDDMVMILLVGVLVGAAAYALFLFSFRRQEWAYLAFAVFALMVAVRALTTGDALVSLLFPDLSFDAYIRIGFLAQYLLIPSAAFFFYHLFPDDISKKELAWYLVPSLVSCLAIPFAPLLVLSWSLVGFFFVASGLVGYGYWAVCLRTRLRRRPGSSIILVAGTVLLGAIALNILNEVFLAKAESSFPLGLVAFVVAQVLAMAKNSTWAFEQTELLTQELKAANQRLAIEAREAEEARNEIEKTLAEKEVLLREVHHRVKNSLQIVLSIISLQTRRTIDPGIRAAYQGIRDRILAISMVHDRLYGMDSEKHVDLLAYLRDLLAQLGESFGEKAPGFRSEISALEVPMDLCLEAGLLMTELVINAYRHGGGVGTPGGIQVALGRGPKDDLVFQVRDGGPGFSLDFNPENTPSAGYKIILSIVQGRQGRLSVLPGPGATVEVRLPLNRTTNT